jgi:hypothetical protein
LIEFLQCDSTDRAPNPISIRPVLAVGQACLDTCHDILEDAMVSS